MQTTPSASILKVKRLNLKASLPDYQTRGAACFDLRTLEAGEVGVQGEIFGTGLAFEVPEGHVMLIFSRSGHGFKNDVRLANCVGVIDEDYRGEVKVKLTLDGHGRRPYRVKAGDRIAQAMVMPVHQLTMLEVNQLSETERGANGLGSTGTA